MAANNQAPLYVGNWTEEEKIYAKRLMDEFRDGNLPEIKDEKEPVLLRAFLAKKLHCNPKRVSKKYENTQYNGRERYDHGKKFLSAEESQRRLQELQRLEVEFYQSRGQLVDLQQHGIHFVIRNRNAQQGGQQHHQQAPHRVRDEPPAVRIQDDRPAVHGWAQGVDPSSSQAQAQFGSLLLEQALARAGVTRTSSAAVVSDDSSMDSVARGGALGLLAGLLPSQLQHQQPPLPQRNSDLESSMIQMLAGGRNGAAPSVGGLSSGGPSQVSSNPDTMSQLVRLYRLASESGTCSDQMKEAIFQCAINEVFKSSAGGNGNGSTTQAPAPAARLPPPPLSFLQPSNNAAQQLLELIDFPGARSTTESYETSAASAAAAASPLSQDAVVSALASQLLSTMQGQASAASDASNTINRMRFRSFSNNGDDGPAPKRSRHGY